MTGPLTLRRLPAVYVRAGTSKGLLLHERDLPADRSQWDRILLSAMGSPDPHGRQLDGMGGGLSSLSKVCILAPSSVPDADIDYTFAQVQIKTASVDWNAICGNMTSAVGPFAVDEGIVQTQGEQAREAVVRIHNTNTGKRIVSRFPLYRGRAAVHGDLEIPGVAGTGAPVRLDFIEPGGASTGRLLPTGAARNRLEVPGFGTFEVSMVDASNACVFVRAADLGLLGTESPQRLEEDEALMRKLASIRIAASVRMGIAPDEATAARRAAIPFIGIVAPPADATTLSGAGVAASQVDFMARVISNGQPHRALPLGVSTCLAVSARIDGTVVHEACRASHPDDADLRIGMPSGVLQVSAEVRRERDAWHAVRGSYYRTQRRLFEGHVLLPEPEGMRA